MLEVEESCLVVENELHNLDVVASTNNVPSITLDSYKTKF